MRTSSFTQIIIKLNCVLVIYVRLLFAHDNLDPSLEYTHTLFKYEVKECYGCIVILCPTNVTNFLVFYCILFISV
jgi:hypothetical protein